MLPECSPVPERGGQRSGGLYRRLVEQLALLESQPELMKQMEPKAKVSAACCLLLLSW